MTSIEIKSLSKKYHDQYALKNVSFDVSAGEKIAIVGPSGSGKTTLLRAIAGLEPITSGTILLDGVDASQLPPPERNMGMMFQNNSLYPHLTVEENIRFAKPKRANLERWESHYTELILWMELKSLLKRMPDQLSGGEQQRVALARALIRSPKTLLLDEPLTHLDRRLSQLVQDNILAAQKRYKMTLLYVTHDTEAALSFADRIVVLKESELMQIGSTKALAEQGVPFVRDCLELDRHCVCSGIETRTGSERHVILHGVQFKLPSTEITEREVSKSTESSSEENEGRRVECRVRLLDWKDAAC